MKHIAIKKSRSLSNYVYRITLKFICISFLLIFATKQVHANGPTDNCVQFKGTLECFPAHHPISDWSYYIGSQTFPTEAALIQLVWTWDAFPLLCQTNACSYDVTPGWDFNTLSTVDFDNMPYGVVWSYADPNNNNEIWLQTKKTIFHEGSNAPSWIMKRTRNVSTYTCPNGANLWIRPISATDVTTTRWCSVPKPPTQTCATAHPCSITSGNKFKPQEDWRANLGPLQFRRNYNSLGPAYNAFIGGAPNANPFGSVWTHNYNLQLIFDTTYPRQVALMRPNGLNISASNNYTDTTVAGTGGWFINRDKGLKLNQLADGTWQVINIKTNDIESYDANGRLTKITYRNGQFVTLIYPATVAATSTTPAVVYYNPTQVTDNFGQSLVFTYNTTGYLTSVTLPTGKLITYTYDAQNRLSTVARPGYGTKTYLYSENSTIAPSGNQNLLTGIVDEKGTRFESYAYDSSDRGISTSMAGGVENFTLNYTANGYNTVTDPHGLTKNYYITSASGSPVVGTSVLMQGGNATLQEHNYTYDAAGNVTSDNHFGILTNYTYDLTRNLETSRTEAVGTPQQRTIRTQWDPNLPVPVLVIEQGRTTAYTYDVTGNVLTKTITDTTAPNISRVWTYTYNSVGQKLTETNPAGQTTTYSYDPSGNGNLLTITDNLGHTTTYSNYNALGQPQQVILANGHKIQYTYDDAGRVVQTDETVSSDAYQTTDGSNSIQWPQWIIDLINALYQLFGQASPFSTSGTTSAVVSQPLIANAVRVDTTRYTYDPIGQLTQVQMPSGEILTYGYDDAHRLVGATDSLGNSITYTLNGAGDITQTVSQDLTGNIKVQTQQVFDTLGRIYQDLGNNGQSSTYTYDNFNNLTNTTDALARNSGSTYDALNRKATDVDALNGTSKYSYNALDQLTKITDARNNSTTYTPNAFGENTQEISPDTGTTSRSYTNGQLNSVVDANGITHSYSYDNLSRVTQRTDGTGTGQLVTQFGYDTGTNDTGSLTSISNADSTMHYSHDTLGNVLEKDIALNTAAPLRVQYKYLAGNKISDIMLPSGHHVTYSYTAGRVTGVSTDSGTLLSSILYSPAGIASWKWGDGSASTDTNTLSYDLDGRIVNINSTGVLGRGYTFDAGNRILSITDSTAGIGTQSYKHDNLDRLTQQVLLSQTLAYGYDANSNRTSMTQTPTVGSAVITSYGIQSSTNRINTKTTGGNSLTSTYLPTGQLVSDGVRVYTYDAAGRSSTIRNGSIIIGNHYNGLGERIRKDVGSTALYFVYDESGHLIGEYNPNGSMVREYIWLGDRIIGMYSQDVPNILLRVHTDHLGTPRAVTQGDGATRQVLWQFEGDAFGDVLPTNPTATVFTMPLRMAGQYFDAEVGISYNYFRDYDPSTGRYVESDPIGLLGGSNTYGYVGASPLLWSDPAGLIKVPKSIKVLCTVVAIVCRVIPPDFPPIDPPPGATQPDKEPRIRIPRPRPDTKRGPVKQCDDQPKGSSSSSPPPEDNDPKFPPLLNILGAFPRIATPLNPCQLNPEFCRDNGT